MEDTLSIELTTIAEPFPGTVGLYLHDLKTNQIITLNPDMLFPMESTLKIPVLLQLYRDKENGLLSLDERITATTNQKAPGSGLLQHFAAGASLTLRDLALLMITVSDNMATDILIQKLTLKRINATLAELDVTPMSINLSMKDSIIYTEENPNYDPLGSMSDLTTPRAMGKLIEKIITRNACSEESFREIKFILSQQKLKTRLPRKLNSSGNIYFAHKTGSSKWSTNDVGFMVIKNRPEIIICIYTLKNDPSMPTYLAEEMIGDMAAAVADDFKL